jgi:hypothetical protein
MIFDALVSFVPNGAPLSLVGGVGVTFPSSIVDLLGAGVGVPPPNIIGTRTTFGTDQGVGGRRPELNVVIGTALVAGTGGTLLKAALQAAQDQGAAGAYQPGTWRDIVSEDNIAPADAVAGAVIFRVPYLPTFPPGFMPRYLRLLFSPMSVTALPAGNFSAGTIGSAMVTMIRDDQANKYAAKNFAVA